MPPYGDAPGPTLPPTQAILHEIDLSSGWRGLQAEAGKVGIPKIRVTLTRLGGINRPFGDPALCHFALSNVLTNWAQ